MSPGFEILYALETASEILSVLTITSVCDENTSIYLLLSCPKHIIALTLLLTVGIKSS